MFTRLMGTTVLAVMIAGSAQAQQAAPSRQAPTQNSKPAAPAAEPATPPKPEPMGQPVNMKLELTISDQTGTAEPFKRTVSFIVADRANGYIRSSNGPMRLNVDASPQLLLGGNTARVRISIEYLPRQTNGDVSAMLNQAVTLVLENGKPFVISQAADPSADRKITVEAKLTVLR